jgi:hypothetical protein
MIIEAAISSVGWLRCGAELRNAARCTLVLEGCVPRALKIRPGATDTSHVAACLAAVERFEE